MEEWKQITDYPNYSVSNFGNVRNNKKNKLLATSISNWGYLRVSLSIKGKRKYFRIHRLVGLAFLENPENKKEIDHIDRNKLNNNVNNLRWATSAENVRNVSKRQNTQSIYKGVGKNNGKWRSRIRVYNKLIHLGYFETEKEAGIAYNNYILEQKLEEFFVLNSIE